MPGCRTCSKTPERGSNAFTEEAISGNIWVLDSSSRLTSGVCEWHSAVDPFHSAIMPILGTETTFILQVDNLCLQISIIPIDYLFNTCCTSFLLKIQRVFQT